MLYTALLHMFQLARPELNNTVQLNHANLTHILHLSQPDDRVCAPFVLVLLLGIRRRSYGQSLSSMPGKNQNESPIVNSPGHCGTVFLITS